ncbi:MAG: 4-deoxy-4-formamido-L-arabinose-phosphoundecaprenol deformylase [Candidatus Riflebacteria bacterium]|nr:4-deoxy-4-formamido-L-arabinose-phosphoundecaprenol deformylase [Candidatus Riflebacteria bacterium]
MRIAIKIDIDTRIGTEQGIPRLLSIFRSHGVRGSFYAVFGPDNSGKAIRRVFTRRGFVGKMARTNPLKIYGLKTLLYGTLLPAPPTGLAFPDLLKGIESGGHELGLHAWDHVLWHDYVSTWDERRVAEELERGAGAFEKVMGRRPAAVAAPGWQVTPASLKVQDGMSLSYASDSRGRSPFYPVVGPQSRTTLQIPGTLPTVDELLGRDGIHEGNVLDHLESLLVEDRLNVYTGHAEIEGMYLADLFERWIRRLVGQGATFGTLAEAADQARSALPPPPRCELVMDVVAGRAGPVACQGALLESRP